MRKLENSEIRDTYKGKNRENWKNLIKPENGQNKLKIFKVYFTLILAKLFWNVQSEEERIKYVLVRIYHQFTISDKTSRDPCKHS